MASSKICKVDGCGKPIRAREWCTAHYSRWHRTGEISLTQKQSEKGEVQRWVDEHLHFEGEGCLWWPFARNNHGYAVMGAAGKTHRAHRIICRMVNGDPPTKGKWDAAHECGNGHLACVHPRHLFWKTRQQNLMDRIKHGTDNRGEKHPLAKLTEENVREIRASAGHIRHGDMAAKYEVTQATIRDIRRRKTWGWLV